MRHGGSALAVSLLAVAGYAFWRTSPVEQVLGSMSTPLSVRDADQRHNASISASRLDGATVQPGATLSFNQTIGPWSRDRGYKRAPVSYNGVLIDAWGGGVCQTSSTLYNAALAAGFEVVERHPHLHAPHYVTPGRDAAVAYPKIDLRLRNPYAFPVTVAAKVARGKVTVTLRGSGRPLPVRVEQRLLASTDPGAERGRKGFEVLTYRLAGGKRTLISHDVYPAMRPVGRSRP